MADPKPIDGEYRVVTPGEQAASPQPVTVVHEKPAFSVGSALAGALLGSLVSYFVPEVIDRVRDRLEGPEEYDIEDGWG